MLSIQCPYCGERDQDEFHYGGEATVDRPAQPEGSGDAEWGRYLFYRENRMGMHLERWVHDFGCRQWFLLERDTLTHEIRAAYRLDETAQQQPGARAPDA
jgi:heterotetrameric sarcosine oxidase delta subunit